MGQLERKVNCYGRTTSQLSESSMGLSLKIRKGFNKTGNKDTFNVLSESLIMLIKNGSDYQESYDCVTSDPPRPVTKEADLYDETILPKSVVKRMKQSKEVMLQMLQNQRSVPVVINPYDPNAKSRWSLDPNTLEINSGTTIECKFNFRKVSGDDLVQYVYVPIIQNGNSFCGICGIPQVYRVGCGHQLFICLKKGYTVNHLVHPSLTRRGASDSCTGKYYIKLIILILFSV